MKNSELLAMEAYAIPFNEVKALILALPYGNPRRIAIEILALTGCRMCELDKMTFSGIAGNVITWQTAKNQRSHRRELLPDWFLRELQFYVDNYPHSNRLLPWDSATLRCYVDKFVRPEIGRNWLLKRPGRRGAVRNEYLYQLKSLRHNWASLDFYNGFLKWGAEMALCRTARRMRHSTHRMTAEHYIDALEVLDLERYKGKEMGDILRMGEQKLIIDYENPKIMEISQVTVTR